MRRIETLLTLLLFVTSGMAADASRIEWPYYGADAGSSKYSPAAQIDAGNVKSLQVAWTWDSPDDSLVGNATRERPGYFKPTPIVIDGVLYTSTGFSQVAAIEAGSGKMLWVFDPHAYNLGRRPANSGWQHRGVAYWSGKVANRTERRILIASGVGELIALDAANGAAIKSFGKDGRVDLQSALIRNDEDRRRIGFNSPQMIVGDAIVIGCTVFDRPTSPDMPAGHVQAFDVRTGAPMWIFHTVPQGNEPGVETWENDAWKYSGDKKTGAVVWEHKMSEPPFGTPMTYVHAGKQYIVVATGGAGTPGRLVAFALPR